MGRQRRGEVVEIGTVVGEVVDEDDEVVQSEDDEV